MAVWQNPKILQPKSSLDSFEEFKIFVKLVVNLNPFRVMIKKILLLFLTLFICYSSVIAQEALITGYVDSPCPQAKGRTLEIYVSGTINFTNWKLVRQANGGGYTFNIDISALGTLTDEFAYITNSKTTLDQEFGINSYYAALIQSGSITDNGDDGFQIEDNQGNIIDRFGEGGVQPTSGDSWYHKKTYYYRNNGETANNGNFDPTNWIFGNINSLNGKGLCNAGNPLSDDVPFGSFIAADITCPPPSQLNVDSITKNSAHISWSVGNEENEWEIRYSKVGFSFESDTVVINDGIPETTLDNLNSGTAYKISVRAVCVENDKSDFLEPIEFSTTCVAATVPFTQDFENLIPPDIPVCANLENTGNGNNWKTLTLTNQSEDYGFHSKVLSYSSDNSNPANAWYFTQGINLEEGITYQIKYLYGNDSTAKNTVEKLKVAYGTTNEVSAMTTTLADYQNIHSGKTTTGNLTFTINTDSIYYFGFQAYSDANQGRLFLDDIIIRVARTCLEPTDISVDNISTTSAYLSWNDENNTSNYKVFYGESGFNPKIEGDSLLINNDSSTALTNLTSGTIYDVYVKTLCNQNEESYLSSVTSFTTLCKNDTVPFSQDFENIIPPNIPNCANLENLGSGHNWEVYDETQSPNPVLNSKVLSYQYDILNSANIWYFTNGIELDSGINYQLTYTYANSTTNTNFFEKLKVGFGSSPQASSMSVLEDYPHISGGIPQSDTLVFSVNTTGVYYLGFKAYSNFNASSLYLDDIQLDYGPSCPKPKHLYYSNLTDTSVHLSWQPQGNASSWKIIYGQTGFNPNTTGNSIDVQGNPQVTLENLIPETQYDIYVRSICSENEESELAGVKSITTHISPPANNLLCNALQLSLDYGCAFQAYTNMGAFSEPSEPFGSCFNDSPGTNTVWFSFTVLDDGNITITTAFPETDFNTEIVVYEAATDCEDLNTLGTEIGCAGFGATLSLHNLNPGETYYIQIAGTHNKSGNFCIEVQTDMGIKKQVFKNFIFSPNPVKNKLTLIAPKPIESVALFNLPGQRVLHKTPKSLQAQLNTQTLQAGVYLMKVNIKGFIKIYKVIKR